MRCIIHLDMDCFYAQVEAQRLGCAPEVPLAVRQKWLIVTSNYAARALGVRKCSSVTEAKKLCPQLLIVCGEDLAPYRRASRLISDLLRNWPAPQQRLGLDEVFMDVSHLISVDGSASSTECDCPPFTHERLQMAAEIANEMRQLIKDELGLTCCAGIAPNKLVAKLAGNLNKPDKQTLIFPCQVLPMMTKLESVKSIPSIGQKTYATLQDLGISSVVDLQNHPIKSLEKALGPELAAKLKNLSIGDDPSPVKEDEPPATISVEDSFNAKQLTDIESVQHNLQVLLNRLIPLLLEDGRRPTSLKVSIINGRETSRQSRGVRISPSLFKTVDDNIRMAENAETEILSIALEQFKKLINAKKGFQLFVLNLGFTNFQNLAGKSGIDRYFVQSDLPSSSKDCPIKRPHDDLPPDVDRDTFDELPDDIKNELIAAWKLNEDQSKRKKE